MGRGEFVESIAGGDFRVVVLAAPPGYDKFTVLRRSAESIGRIAWCDLSREASIASAVLDGVVAGDDRRAAASAADRLAQPTHTTASADREALRHEWAVDAGPELLVLYDPDGRLSTPEGTDVAAELLSAFPPARRIALCTRRPLPPLLLQRVDRYQPPMASAQELSLSRAQSLEVLRSRSAWKHHAEAVFEVLQGWPMVTRMLAAIRPPRGPEDFLESARRLQPSAIFAFVTHRAIAALSVAAREGLFVVQLLGRCSYLDIVRIVGDAFDDAALAEISDSALVEHVDGELMRHPEVARIVRARFEPDLHAEYERVVRALIEQSRYVEAARIALDYGDAPRAAAIIDAGPPFTAATAPLGDYARIVARIDRDLITQYPNFWMSTIPYRSFSVDPSTYVREAETVYYCLSPAVHLEQRATAVMLLASAYANVGRLRECYALVDEALSTFAADPVSARASILNFAASLRGIEGRFSTARELAKEASEIVRGGFGEAQALLYIEAHLAAYRGEIARVVAIIDELLRRRKRDELPLYLAYAAVSGAIFAWFLGEDAAFERYTAVLEDNMTPGLAPEFGPIVDSSRGRQPKLDDERLWPANIALALIYQIAHLPSPAEALGAAQRAASAADVRGDPLLQLLAHTAIYVLDGSARTREATILSDIVRGIESAPFQQAVADLLGGGEGGMLATFVRRRVKRLHVSAASFVDIQLLRARVVVNGSIAQLTAKEFELVALLASTRGVLPRDRIGEALWDHLDPEEWRNNLKVTVYRLRKKLERRDVVIGDDAGYRISPDIEIDLRRAEASTRRRPSEPLSDVDRNSLRAVLEEFSAAHISKYERFTWAHSLVARIAEVISSAGLALAQDAASSGDVDAVVAFTNAVREADPYNEDACSLVIAALFEAGRADAARREYRRYSAALQRDLGSSPPERVLELMKRHGHQTWTSAL